MHEAAFSLAALPERTTVLGLTLRPYSLGHELFLIRESNPLVLNNPNSADKSQLMQAALICCQTFKECRDIHTDRFIGIKLRIWGWRIGSDLKFGLQAERRRFLEYRRMGTLELPQSDVFKPERKAKRPAGTPFLLRLHQFLMFRLGFSEAAAWDYPLGLAKMRYQAYWEAEGGIEIHNEQDEEFDRFVEEQEAKGRDINNGKLAGNSGT